MKVKALVAAPSAKGTLLNSRQQANAEAVVGRMLAASCGVLSKEVFLAY